MEWFDWFMSVITTPKGYIIFALSLYLGVVSLTLESQPPKLEEKIALLVACSMPIVNGVILLAVIVAILYKMNNYKIGGNNK